MWYTRPSLFCLFELLVLLLPWAEATQTHLHSPPLVVTVRLEGGLGNQLFQVAAAAAVAAASKRVLALDKSQTHARGGRRTYFQRGLFSGVQALDTASFEQLSPHHVRETGFRFQPLSLPSPRKAPALCLIGFFQSEQYFYPIRKDLVKLFGLKPLSSGLGMSKTTVALHVRRSDYVGDPKHTVLPLSYYKSALDLMRERVGPYFHIIVFSDDYEWCVHHLPAILPQGGFSLGGAQSDELDDFRHMMVCTHHIIANSSFSWWAAYLARLYSGEKTGHVVIAPRQWFKDDQYIAESDWQSIYVSSWVVLEGKEESKFQT